MPHPYQRGVWQFREAFRWESIAKPNHKFPCLSPGRPAALSHRVACVLDCGGDLARRSVTSGMVRGLGGPCCDTSLRRPTANLFAPSLALPLHWITALPACFGGLSTKFVATRASDNLHTICVCKPNKISWTVD